MRSKTLTRLAHITYRQLDYLTRTNPNTLQNQATPGSGNHRQYTPHQAIRIILAAHIATTTHPGDPSHSTLPQAATHLLNHPHPIPPTGWITHQLTPPQTTTIHTNPLDLIDHITNTGPTLVARYDLHDLLKHHAPVWHDGRLYSPADLVREGCDTAHAYT